MGRKSTLEALPQSVRAAVARAMENGATIDAIVAQLDAMGHEVSRSAVGRYAKNFAEMTKRHRDMRIVAEAFAEDFGGGDNAEGKLLLQMLTSIGARMVMPVAKGDDIEMTTGEFHTMAKATKELFAAAKSDADRDAKIRAEAAREAREKAADDAASAARAAGASEETVALVKARILGIDILGIDP